MKTSNIVYAYINCHVREWLYMCFELVTGFIEMLQIVTTGNYSAIADLDNLPFTTGARRSVVG
jgi:hypothetical protein